MNLERYEKIDGWQALERMKNEEKVIREEDGLLVTYELIAGLIFESDPNEDGPDTSPIVLNDLLGSYWYIPKPFDVRQAMLDRPNEWVGAFKNDYGNWCVAGFDTSHFNAVCKNLSGHLPVDTDVPGVGFPSPEELDACIPIEDVPEEATR